jgi:hypothetical protein
MTYVDCYTKPFKDYGKLYKQTLDLEHDLSDEEKKQNPDQLQALHMKEFMENLVGEIRDAIMLDKPVNLVIEAIHKGSVTEFVRKIEFLYNEEDKK